jgi:hypothetical protein
VLLDHPTVGLHVRAALAENLRAEFDELLSCRMLSFVTATDQPVVKMSVAISHVL